jgi:predicted PurR-regulated permease PerM
MTPSIVEDGQQIERVFYGRPIARPDDLCEAFGTRLPAPPPARPAQPRERLVCGNDRTIPIDRCRSHRQTLKGNVYRGDTEDPWHRTPLIGFLGVGAAHVDGAPGYRLLASRILATGPQGAAIRLRAYDERSGGTMPPEVNVKASTGKECLQRPAFYVLVFIVGYLAYLVLAPFLVPLIWAVIFGIVFRTMQVELSRRLGPSGAALFTTLIVAILIVAPAVMLVSVLAREVPQVANSVQQASLPASDQVERLWQMTRQRVPFPLPEDPTELAREAIQRVLAFLAPRAGAVVADVFATIGSLVVMLFALFFVLRDGDRMAGEVRNLLPLPMNECDRLMQDTRDLVIASVGAGMVVAALQGAIGGLTFWILGIDAAVFWAVVMAFCSIIPVVGAALVWMPAAVWLLLSGEIARGVILLVVGALGISMADNVIRPLLLAGRTSLSGLVIFFGLLGGMAAFGFVGIVLGPIVLVVTGGLLKLFTWPDLVEEGLSPPSSR